MAEQYGDDRNLASRQAIYRFRRPGPDLHDWALDLAALAGDEGILDIGCGNGRYLQRLAQRGHRGPVTGVDLSVGMRPAVVADAEALPCRDGAADVVLCMHVLYHVPEQRRAVAELRRAARGRAIVATNSVEHLREMDDLAPRSPARDRCAR